MDWSLWHQQTTLFGIEVWRAVALFLSLLLSYVMGTVLRAVLRRLAERFERHQRDYAAVLARTLARTAVFALLTVGLNLGLGFLPLLPAVRASSDTVISILFVLVVAYGAYCLVDLVDAWLSRVAGRTESKLDDMLVPMVRSTLRGTVVVLALVQVATIVSDKPMTSVIAGLGVGGLAIGLAAQDTIKNFFGSLMIFGDRPFEMGNLIEACGEKGNVEAVGFRSTRIRTPDGHLVTIPNGLLAGDKVKNVAARPYVKRTLTLGVTYGTSAEKLRQALDIVRKLLANHEGQMADFPPRVFFSDFQDSALAITAIYWYSPADYWQYMAFSEQLNFAILEQFNAAGIEFAFPSRTVYLVGPGKSSETADNGGPTSSE